jgi:hypothetical protein
MERSEIRVSCFIKDGPRITLRSIRATLTANAVHRQEALHRVRDTRLSYAAALCRAISALYNSNSSAIALATLGRARSRS